MLVSWFLWCGSVKLCAGLCVFWAVCVDAFVFGGVLCFWCNVFFSYGGEFWFWLGRGSAAGLCLIFLTICAFFWGFWLLGFF